jgi:hypothetical protein
MSKDKTSDCVVSVNGNLIFWKNISGGVVVVLAILFD